MGDDLARVAEFGIGHIFFAIDGPIEHRLAALAALRRCFPPEAEEHAPARRADASLRPA